MKVLWKHVAIPILALALLLPASRASAIVAANTRIFSEATLTYNDGTGDRTSKASVVVTVSLVPGLATISTPDNGSAVYNQVNTETDYAYTVTAGGNGPDTYTVAIAVVGSSNTDSPGAAIQKAELTFPLGATISTLGSDQLNILVPADGTADGKVNEIAAGDFVLINGEVRQVDQVNDPVTGTATIVLKTALSVSPGAGVPVLEQVSFNTRVLSGTIQGAGASITVTAETSVTNSAGKVSDQVVSTYSSGAAVLIKFARNMTNSAANTGGTGSRSFTANGATANYFTGGVTATANDLIEYVLLVENGGTAAVTNCTIADLLPVDFVVFQTGVYQSKDFLYVDAAGAETALTAAADGDTGVLAGSDLTFHLGTGATSSAGGSIDPGTNVKVLYRVKVN